MVFRSSKSFLIFRDPFLHIGPFSCYIFFSRLVLTPPPHALPRLKLVGIMLETSNLARKYKNICRFRKYTS